MQPDVHSAREVRISWIWLVPLIAALVGGSLLVRNWMLIGPTVTISFESAEGLEVGQTKIRYKEVVIGQVTDIDVASDRTRVLVRAQLNREGSSYITQEDTRFWVVRPRLGISGVSGLGTLLSGAYISVDASETQDGAKPVYEFIGLEKPPEVTSGRPGTRFTLHAPDMGSLEIGSPVYYRRIEVGRVIGYDLDASGRSVNIQVFVDAPNDKFVTVDTRFWNASGINLSLDADGFRVEAGSAASILAGGIAFASADPSITAPAKADTVFALRDTEAHALADTDGPPFEVNMRFHQSVRGLQVGAPVEFRGLDLGRVVDVDLDFDPATKTFYALVQAEIYPLRFGQTYEDIVKLDPLAPYPGNVLLGPLVHHGLRAQIRAANLLTGQQYIALDFFPDAEPVEVDLRKSPLLLPTVAGSFDRLQQQLSTIVAKIETIPFSEIGQDLRASLQSTSKLVSRLEGQLAPQATSTLKAAQRSLNELDKLLAQDSPMNSNLENTMRELSAAARSLRALADYLQTNPTALIRGRPADVLPVSP